MKKSSVSRASLALVALVLVGALAGCKSSDKVVVDTVTVGTKIKCAMGQSFVKEAGDDTPTQFGAGTEAWKDYYCANADTGAPWWDSLDVQARKYNGNALCDVSPFHSTTTDLNVTTSATATCTSSGSSSIHVIGTHGATRTSGGALHRDLTLTPNVFTY